MITADNLTQMQIVTLHQELIQLLELVGLTDSQLDLKVACNRAMNWFDTTDVVAARKLIADHLNGRMVTRELIDAWWFFGGPGPADSRTMQTALGEPLAGVLPTSAEITAARALIAESIRGMDVTPEALLADYRIAHAVADLPIQEPPVAWQDRVLAAVDEWLDRFRLVIFIAAGLVVAAATLIATRVL